MPTINDRIVELLDNLGLKKSQFAEKLSVSQPYVSQLCSGVRTPSDRTIADICREFRVREEWLRTGEGPMLLPEPEEDLEIINDLLADTASPTADLIRNIWRTYRQLPPDHQKVLDNFIATLLNQK